MGLLTRRSPVRVGLVIGQLSVGGAEGQLRELVTRIDRRRVEPLVYSLHPAPEGVRRALYDRRIELREVGARGVLRAIRLTRLLRQDRVELIHSWLFIANTYAWLARFAGVRVPLIVSVRNCKRQGVWHDLANVAACRASAVVVVNSQRVADYVVRQFRAPRERIRVVYNGVDTERFRPVPNGEVSAAVIVTAGRLVPQKNPNLFLDAAELLLRRHPNVRFVIVGDGPLRPRIENRLRKSPLADAVSLLGERDDVDRILRGAGLFWLTSAWEGLPNVVLEAMACGLPVVTTDVGGAAELVRDGREGFVVPPGEARRIAARSDQLLSDPELRSAMSRRARARALEFALPMMVTGMEDLYDEVAARTVGGGRA